jgi:hypothetical protein
MLDAGQTTPGHRGAMLPYVHFFPTCGVAIALATPFFECTRTERTGNGRV